MNTSQRYPNPLIIVAARLLLGLLALVVLAGEVIVVMTAQELVRQYPEFADLHVPLVSAAIIFGICVELVFIIAGVLVGYIRSDRIFGKSALRLVNLLIAVIAFATVVVVYTLFLIPGPPALALLILGGAVFGSALTLILLALRSLLLGAVSMRVELDEVV